MRGNKVPLKRNYPQIWTSPFYQPSWASLHGRNSPGPGQNFKNKMETPNSIQASEFKESRVHELNP
jgi:hypothetical protein